MFELNDQRLGTSLDSLRSAASDVHAISRLMSAVALLGLLGACATNTRVMDVSSMSSDEFNEMSIEAVQWSIYDVTGEGKAEFTVRCEFEARFEAVGYDQLELDVQASIDKKLDLDPETLVVPEKGRYALESTGRLEKRILDRIWERMGNLPVAD